MPPLAITGHLGTIGTVLTEALAHHHPLGLDLPDHDLADYPRLVQALRGAPTEYGAVHAWGGPAHTVVHLAGDYVSENWGSGTIAPHNFELDLNLLKASAEVGVQRVVLASSVHIDNFLEWEGPGLLRVDRPGQTPTSPYGAHKAFLEALGRHFADRHPMEIVALRIGGVTKDGRPRTFACELQVFLSHSDLVSLLEAVLRTAPADHRFVAMYAVSNNEGRMHDVANPFGWFPASDSARFF